MPVRIAAVRYLNTVPLVEGLDKLEGVELTLAAPSHIAGMVRSGAADIGLVSLIDAARAPGPPAAAHGALSLLPVGMIGCDGPTLTVRLFSAVPLDRVAAVHADTDSHTSVALALVLLDRLHGVRPPVIDYDARERVSRGGAGAPAAQNLDESWPETLLLIGDKVVSDSPPAVRYPHQLDLGQAWKDLTGLPFVYAAWACRAEDADASHIRAAAAVLDRQRRRNLARLDWIIETRAPEHRWPTDLARRYIGSLLRYTVDDRARQGAARFLEECARRGLAPGAAAAWTEWNASSTLLDQPAGAP